MINYDVDEEEDPDMDRKKMKGTFSVEKGIKCTGEFEKGKGMCQKCEGGLLKEFTVGVSGEEIADDIASELFEQVHGMMPKDSFMPLDEDIEAMMAFDDMEMLEDGGGDFSKSVEFGGFVKAEWGCKVTFGKEKGKFSKKLDCGLKGVSGMGKGPKEEDYDLIVE
jgi:hypothetical protein